MATRNWLTVVVWLTVAPGAVRAQFVDVTAPGNPIVGVAATLGGATSTLATAGGSSGNSYPLTATPANAIDNTLSGSKYQNFQQSGAGFIVSPSAASRITAFRFATGNDAPERDPFTVTIEGTNSALATTTLNSSWTTIYSGVSGLATDPGRDAFGSTVNFSNTLTFTSYRLLVSAVRTPGTANSFQFDEIELLTPVPEPSSFALACVCVGGLLCHARRRKAPSAA